ncbi:SRPBCC family protein [Fervidobacterium islandicum]|uniref:SRPBCC domain-containing protein n=1 Tax=Fervidobacterium islandicum TaxID=2423 RepID=A0AAI8GDF1_FERIS|nr:SRPBCC domain-containing protein [Fervidobacterium islandicum]AMW32944.1 SRPBCC domain-containing protein [Fervidobacterium islandicum]
MPISNDEMEFHERFKAPIDVVWKTFYNPNGWDPWFTDGMKIDEDSGEIYFRWFRLTDGQVVTDTGRIVSVVHKRIFSFWWYEYEDGYRSFVELSFQPTSEDETIVTVKDRTFVKDENELHIRYGCAYGWGQMLLLAKVYVERGLILI